jgi:Cu-processing system permease protein
MRSVLAIAGATVLEARRNRVAWSLLFFCLVLVLTSFVFQEVTIASFDRIVRDVGMATVSLFGVLLGVFLGVGAVGRDIDRRIVYILVGKPISRFQYLLGRTLGAWFSVSLSLALMSVALFLECFLYRGPITLVMIEGLVLLMVETLVLVSLAVMASCFAGSLIASFISVSGYVIGHFSEDIYFAGRRSASAAVRSIAAAVFYAMPNLERLNLKSEISTLTPVSLARFGGGIVYGLLYAALFLAIAAVVFERRDLK